MPYMEVISVNIHMCVCVTYYQRKKTLILLSDTGDVYWRVTDNSDFPPYSLLIKATSLQTIQKLNINSLGEAQYINNTWNNGWIISWKWVNAVDAAYIVPEIFFKEIILSV
jgi:hypothetical protein